MRTYSGVRRHGRLQVLVDGLPLDARRELAEYSADGFDWGAHTKGTKQLALAILADYFERLADGEARLWADDRLSFANQKALAACEEFAVEMIEPIDTDRWVLFDLHIANWIEGEAVQVCDVGRVQGTGARI